MVRENCVGNVCLSVEDLRITWPKLFYSMRNNTWSTARQSMHDLHLHLSSAMSFIPNLIFLLLIIMH